MPDDHASIESIWTAFSAQLRRYIFSKVGDPMSADDILQDVFVKIHANIGQLHAAQKLSSWVFRITHNAIIDHYRQRKAVPLNYDEVAIVDDNMVTNDAAIQLSRSLRGMIAALPENYRKTFDLTVFQGQTQESAAVELGVSVSAVKSRVRRGRKLLKAMFEECCHIELDRRGTVIDYHPVQECRCCQPCKPTSASIGLGYFRKIKKGIANKVNY